MKIIDITLPIYPAMITYPGNPEVRFEPEKGETTFRTKVYFGTHTGTHIDMPSHAFRNGKTLDDISLYTLIGPCRVLDMTKVKKAVSVRDLEVHKIKNSERILIKTRNSSRGFKRFYGDYVYLDGDAADWLMQKRISLFGIDSLSVKQRGGSDIRAHTSLLKKGVVILEGINLDKVVPGTYELTCLPLRLRGLDGSPVRAILIKK